MCLKLVLLSLCTTFHFINPMKDEYIYNSDMYMIPSRVIHKGTEDLEG